MTSARASQLGERYGEYARSMVDSLSVTMGTDGGPYIRLHENEHYGVFTEKVTIRHVAKYKGGDSFLKVRMMQDMTLNAHFIANEAADVRVVDAEPDKHDKARGIPDKWYEASISSVRAEELLEENALMEWGNEVKWTVEDAKEEGVFAALYKPALAMVSQMDLVGCFNDNRQ